MALNFALLASYGHLLMFFAWRKSAPAMSRVERRS
jgi:hypothetical protein